MGLSRLKFLIQPRVEGYSRQKNRLLRTHGQAMP